MGPCLCVCENLGPEARKGQAGLSCSERHRLLRGHVQSWRRPLSSVQHTAEATAGLAKFLPMSFLGSPRTMFSKTRQRSPHS